MRIEKPHAQARKVDKLEVMTPLIAPSFSSRGFPQVSELWKDLKYKLYGVCLASAFDIAEGHFPADLTGMVNLAIIDSGIYETDDQLNGYGNPASDANWTRQRYCETVSSIDKATNLILVNFDQIGNFEDQIEAAIADFSCAPDAAPDFLIKPEALEEPVNLAKLVRWSDKLEQFAVIGIAAREAGSSLLKRCRSIVMLRDMLEDAGLDMPIHVFGAITPYEVLTYYLCGADIFDGLNWLRLAYRDHASIPIEEAAIEELKWNWTDADLLIGEWTHNLGLLSRLQQSLRHYSNTRELGCLEEEFPVTQKAVRLAKIAGAEIH